MELKYNAAGNRRKELVKAISEITGAESKYCGAPTFAYTVDYFTIDRDGNVSFDDRADSEEVENLIERLDKAGFAAEPVDMVEIEIIPTDGDEDGEKREAEKVSDESETSERGGFVGEHGGTEDEQCGTTGEREGFAVEFDAPAWLTIEVPRDKVNLENLDKLLVAKGALIKKALGIDDLPIDVREDSVRFPWFTDLPDVDSANTYSRFIAALCEMSRERTRITAKEKPVENEKYAFRCFLLRLGFIGDEYKADRKILLRNLSGSSAFRDGQPKTITTVCYNQRDEWKSRKNAMAYFEKAMNGCDPNSSEYSRYEKVHTELSLGKNVCTDKD